MKSILSLRFLTAMEGQQSHIAVDAVINGKPALMIIDTGASNCVLDLARAVKFELLHDPFFISDSAIGIGSGQLSVTLSRSKYFALGTFRIELFPFVLLDLATINATFAKAGCEPVDGIIGTDLLLAANAVIDYKSATITFRGNKKVLKKLFQNISLS